MAKQRSCLGSKNKNVLKHTGVERILSPPSSIHHSQEQSGVYSLPLIREKQEEYEICLDLLLLHSPTKATTATHFSYVECVSLSFLVFLYHSLSSSSSPLLVLLVSCFALFLLPSHFAHAVFMPSAVERKLLQERAAQVKADGWNKMGHLRLKRFADDDKTLTPGARRNRAEHPYEALAELSPSGRSKCKSCGQLLNRHQLRMTMMLQCHKGYKVSCTLHPACFWQHPEVSKLSCFDEIELSAELAIDDKKSVLAAFNIHLAKHRMNGLGDKTATTTNDNDDDDDDNDNNNTKLRDSTKKTAKQTSRNSGKSGKRTARKSQHERPNQRTKRAKRS
eukprot:g36986.t1